MNPMNRRSVLVLPFFLGGCSPLKESELYISGIDPTYHLEKQPSAEDFDYYEVADKDGAVLTIYVGFQPNIPKTNSNPVEFRANDASGYYVSGSDSDFGPGIIINRLKNRKSANVVHLTPAKGVTSSRFLHAVEAIKIRSRSMS